MQTSMTDTMVNGIDTEALTRTMDAVKRDPSTGIAQFHVTTAWKGGAKSETRVTDWTLGGERKAKDFTILVDEPPELLGEMSAPNPQEYLMAAANACMMATYVAACAMQGITLESIEIETTGELDLRGFLGLDKKVPAGYEEMAYTVRIKGDGTPEQFEKVHQWVMATSPNYYNMANAIWMKPTLVVE